MDENENFDLNTDETIEETVNEDGSPADNTDNEQDPAVDDPTSENVQDDEENENFLGTFKTKEDADKGFKSAQAKITEQANRIKELESKLNPDTSQQLPDVDKAIADIKTRVNAEYSERLRGLGVKYSSYMPEDAVINTIDDIVRNLPPLDVAKFVNELNAIQNDCNGKLQKEIELAQKNAVEKFEAIKTADKERYKDNETVFNAWYNPPQTIEEVALLIESVKKQAIEDYIKEQSAKQEDNTHKNKLSTTANTANKKFNEGHIFTRKEIANMSTKEFLKYEKMIDAQIAKGLVN